MITTAAAHASITHGQNTNPVPLRDVPRSKPDEDEEIVPGSEDEETEEEQPFEAIRRSAETRKSPIIDVNRLPSLSSHEFDLNLLHCRFPICPCLQAHDTDAHTSVRDDRIFSNTLRLPASARDYRTSNARYILPD